MTGEPLVATYRLQVHKDFTLKQARAIVAYLRRLGVSHMYSSPQLRARSGSTHGYDVVAPLMLNPELGDESDRRALIDALHGSGMGLVLDIVPNHMGVGNENPYWQDVLMHGPASPYASWFDIDSGAGRDIARTRVLLPVLGKELAESISSDELTLGFENGLFRVVHSGSWFPLDPTTVSDILNHDIAEVRSALGDDDPDLREFDEIVDGLSSMPPRWSTEEGSREERRRRTDETYRRLEALLGRSIALRDHLSRTCRTFAAGQDGHRRMRALLDMQVYELAFWQHAAKRINYRRFFDISDLAGIRIEDPQVFADTHRLIFEWIADGSLDGLRVDHIDGLLDPQEYLDRLRRATAGSGAGESFPVFVEKILSPGERLRETWPVQGTTGYEFLNDLAAAFVSPEGSRALDEAFRARLKLSGRHMDFATVAHEGKRRVLAESLRADVRLVARLFAPLAKGVGTPRALKGLSEQGITALIAGLPVYRTYLDGRSELPHPDDAEMLQRALSDARHRDDASESVLDRLAEVFLESRGSNGVARIRFIGRFQQLSGPATAKGIEDTALYRYIPLASLNEVGSAPDRDLTTASADLHRANALRAERWPHNLLCTNTHDTKRSADIRSRLHVLAEIPEEWSRLVSRWRRVHAPLRVMIGRRSAPDAVTEYLLYQTLAGIWPFPSEGTPTAAAIAPLRERAEAYMIKAAREAKSRTSWTEPDEKFENALKSFLAAILEEERLFVNELTTVVSAIARPGIWNALSRLIVHLTAPGIPDLYQGDELWNFSLVDPDNRRPVDYDRRERLLSEIERKFSSEGGGSGAENMTAAVAELLESAEGGRIKLYLTWRVLKARRDRPAAFLGNYRPLEATGSTSAHLFAFLRERGGDMVATLASRLPRTLTGTTNPPTADAWKDAALTLPPGRWRCELSGIEVVSAGAPLPVRELLRSLPVGLFIKL